MNDENVKNERGNMKFKKIFPSIHINIKTPISDIQKTNRKKRKNEVEVFLFAVVFVVGWNSSVVLFFVVTHHIATIFLSIQFS